MSLLAYLVVFIICLAIIVKSGSLMVHSLVSISRYLRLSGYVVAFILMAFATSVPELFVGLTAAIFDKGTLSLGNVIGANVVNLTLAVGLVIIVARGIRIEDTTPKKDAWIIFFLAMLPILLALDGALSRIDGTILLLFFVWYLTRLLSRKDEYQDKLAKVKHNVNKFKDFIKSFASFGLGLVLLLIGAWGIVWSASMIAELMHMSLLFIGIILLALGTTLPEIVFGLRSVLMHHEDMTLGNFIGSVAFNSLFVLGLVALINPIIITNITTLQISGLMLALTLLVFNLFIRTKNRLSYREGFVLLIIYVFFVIVESLIS